MVDKEKVKFSIELSQEGLALLDEKQKEISKYFGFKVGRGQVIDMLLKKQADKKSPLLILGAIIRYAMWPMAWTLEKEAGINIAGHGTVPGRGATVESALWDAGFDYITDLDEDLRTFTINYRGLLLRRDDAEVLYRSAREIANKKFGRAQELVNEAGFVYGEDIIFNDERDEEFQECMSASKRWDTIAHDLISNI